MGLMDRIKKVTGTNDSFDDSYDDDYYQGFDNGYDEGAVPQDDDMQVAGGMGGMNMNSTQQIGTQPMAGMGMNTMNTMGSAPMTRGDIGISGANIKMQVVYPKTYNSNTASQIANHLLNKCTVVLNLEQTNKETSRRLIDFLSGVAYSIGGSLKKIAVNAYVVTPSNVDVDEAKIKPAPRRSEPQPEAKEPASNEDFSDFN